jgi:hypothetical protein
VPASQAVLDPTRRHALVNRSMMSSELLQKW